MWSFVAVCLGIPFLIYYFKQTRFDYWNKRNVPTASGCHWLFGHLKDVLFQAKHLSTVVEKMYKEFPEAPLVGYFKLHTPGLLIRDPIIIQKILIHEFSNFAANGFYVDRKYDFLAGSNPFFVKAEDWKAVRTHASAALTYAKLKGYLPRMRAVAHEMVKYVTRRCEEGVTELAVKEIAEMFSSDVLGYAICGVVNNTFEQRDSLFAAITREASFVTSVADNLKDALLGVCPALNCIFQMRFSSPKSDEQLLHVTRTVIKERQASGDKRDDLYQVAMTMRENDTEGVFTDEYISSLVYTIMLDQYETTGNVMVNMLFAIAWHPEVQEKLRKEIIDFKSSNNGNYTVDDVENLKYLDMVLSESLRMFSPVPVLSRECTNDCFIPVPGLEKPLHITKGTPIIVPNQSIHMDPKYYPEPDKFDPERFTDEEIAKRPKFTYLPFGEGPKRCLGPRLGALQVKMAVMSLVEHFWLRPAEVKYPLAITPGIFLILCPMTGTNLIFEPIPATS